VDKLTVGRSYTFELQNFLNDLIHLLPKIFFQTACEPELTNVISCYLCLITICFETDCFSCIICMFLLLQKLSVFADARNRFLRCWNFANRIPYRRGKEVDVLSNCLEEFHSVVSIVSYYT